MSIRFLALISSILTISTICTSAQTINYQGRLVESGVLVNGSRDIEFRIYSTESPTLMLFAETGRVDVVDGFYSYEIGTSPLPAGNYGIFQPVFGTLSDAHKPNALWPDGIPEKELRIYIDGILLNPAEKISHTPHALVAEHVVYDAIGSVHIQDGAVQYEDLATGALTSPIEQHHQNSFKELTPLMAASPLSADQLKPFISPSGFSVVVGGTSYSQGLAFRVEEAISEPMRAEVLFAGTGGVANPALWINNNAELLVSRSGTTRRFSGIVTQATRLGHDGSEQHYAVVIESHIVRLRYNSGYALWQEQRATDSIDELFSNAGITFPNILSSLPSRGSIFQFKETELEFTERQLERDGGWYIFNDSAPEPGVIIGDANSHFLTGPSLNYYGPNQSPSTNEEYICTFNSGAFLYPGTYNTRAYVDPSGSVVSGSATITGGSGIIHTLSSAISGLEANDMASDGVESKYHENSPMGGSSTAAALKPGRSTTIVDFSSGAATSGNYLIGRVVHTGLMLPGTSNQYYYANQFSALSLAEEYASAQKTENPDVSILTATVTGPAGEDIYPDQHGRVKVQFHWDTTSGGDENSSGWIPVMRPVHGNDQSSFFIPEVDDEVLVSFIGNDPDRPVIIGSIPSTQQQTYHALPAQKNLMYMYNESIGGSVNEIRLDKSNGSENILMTSPDINLVANNSVALFAPSISFSSEVSAPSAALSGPISASSGSFSGSVGASSLSANSATVSGFLNGGVYSQGRVYADNQVVAWARISSAASVDRSFGIVSTTSISAGVYEITIDAPVSGVDLIAIATPEIDVPPSSASTVRHISVNQINTPANTFRVYINNGSGTPVNNDFLFMVTGR